MAVAAQYSIHENMESLPPAPCIVEAPVEAATGASRGNQGNYIEYGDN